MVYRYRDIILYTKSVMDDIKDTIIEIEVQKIIGILKIMNCEYLGVVKKMALIGIINGLSIHKILKIEFLPLDNCYDEEMILYCKNLIQTHDFYIATGVDSIEEEYVWNLHMIDNFLKHTSDTKEDRVITHYPYTKTPDYNIGHLICGYFISKSFACSNDFFNMKIFSLVSTKKMGARFLSRGIDREGNVSFFVKTYFQIKRNNKIIFNFMIIRGSIPLFWTQKNKGVSEVINVFGTRAETHKSFSKHLKYLNEKYGDIHVISLLGKKKGEKELNEEFINLLNYYDVEHTVFDLNSYINDFDSLKKIFYKKLSKIDKEVVFRVNCVDCLDRTNLAQFLICKFIFKKTVNPKNKMISKKMQECWTENGNSLSNLYTGSDVMRSELSLKEKRSFFGLIDDLFISATRLINCKFTDKQKHKIINLLLGKYFEVVEIDDDNN